MTTNTSILLSFLKLENREFLSGETLATEHGISRVAINARIKKLTQSGIVFEAIPRRGYRLAEEPAQLHSDLLQAHILLNGPNLAVQVILETDSTNLEVERRLASGETAPIAVIAHNQTEGRGRMGRIWHSTDPRNLYLSIGFRPETLGTAIANFSLWAGVKLAETLQSQTDLPVQVKWPNDLQVGGRKIAGILCEAKMELDRVQTLVFGFGLNVNQDANNLPGGFRTPATTLKTLLGRNVAIHPLTTAILQAVLDGYSASHQSNSGQLLQETFSQFDALRDQPVTTHNGSTKTQGIARGIDECGNLLLQITEGKTISMSAGDVSLKE